MIKETAWHMSVLPQIALVLFMAFFIGAVLLVLTDRRRQHIDHMSRLPLDDDHNGGPDHG